MPEVENWSNLLWATGTPSIVHNCGLPWLPAERQAELTAFFSRPDIRAQLAPELETFIEASPSRRLGVYFEDLWAFAFSHHPHYELLARNLPLRAEGRTLGELDFVVRHLPSGSIEHWEVAVKFYLQLDGYWIGPGLRDRLDSKLARMCGHQLPVAYGATAQSLLRDMNIHIDRQRTLMPGRLFRRLGQPEPAPPPVDPHSCRYWWATREEFQHHFQDRPWHWLPLPKRAWLAECKSAQGLSCAELCEQLAREEPRRPLCVAGLAGSEELSRGFIVPEGWQASAHVFLADA